MRHLLPIIVSLAAFAAHAQLPDPGFRATGPDITFENQGLRLVVGPGGECKSLYDKTLGIERNCHFGHHLMRAVAAGNRPLALTSCVAQGNLLNVTFGDNEAHAVIEVQTHPTFLGFVIRSYRPDDLEKLTVLSLLVTKQETIAASFGVMHDSRAALGVQTLHFSGQQLLQASGDLAVLGCTYNRLARDRKALYRPPVARGCALLACPRDQLVPTMQAIERAYGLPSPRIDGVWGKLSPAMRRSYLMVKDLTTANVDEVAAYAKRGNFDYVLLVEKSWSNRGGTFAINEKAFPGGLPTLKAAIGKLQKAGLKVGLHLLTAGMTPTDPLVTPVPDKGIYSNATVPLAADIDETATFIPTATSPPVEFPVKGIPGPGHGTVLWIGDELVRYSKPKRNPAYGFENCQRGLWGTKPAAHRVGDPIKHIFVMYNHLVLMDADSELLERVSQRVADVMNYCNCDGIYFDGSENLQGTHSYYNARLQMAYLDKITRTDKDLIIQGSSYSPYTWHSMCRMASADGFRKIKLWIDKRTPTFQWYFDTLMPLDIGWYAINSNIRPDDMEYICSRAIGYNSAISVQTSTQALDTVPQAHEMIDMIGRWEDLRRSGRVPEALREQMRQPGHEFRLTRRGNDDVLVPIEYSAWASNPPLLLPAQVPANERDPLRSPDDVESTLTLTNKRSQPAEIELHLECGKKGIRPGPSYAAGMPLELFENEPARADSRTLGTNMYNPTVRGRKNTGEGVTQEITLVTDDVKEGKSACRFSATSTLAKTGGWAAFGRSFDPPISLRDYAVIGLWVKGDGQCELLKVQLWDAAGKAQDELITISFRGWRYIELPRPTDLHMDYEHIVRLFFYYNGMPGNSTCTTVLDGVKVLSGGTRTVMQDPTLIVNDQPITFPTAMVQGERLVLRSNGECWLYHTGVQERQRVTPQGNWRALTGDVTVTAQDATHQLRFRGAMLWPTLGTVLPEK